MNLDDIQSAVTALQSGKVVAYPTEAVWGLGCDPFNHEAFLSLLALKERPLEKGVIIVAASQAQVAPLIEGLSDEQRQLLDSTWPGPFTWILPDPSDWIPQWIKGQHSGVAVRVSAHPVVQALCGAFGPMVSTSANPAGDEPARSLDEVNAYFNTGLGGVVDGPLGGQTKPTQIRDILSNQTLRD